MKMMVSTKNKWVVIKDYDDALDKLDERTRLNVISKRYRNDTEWSDFNTLIPALFLLIHGLELAAKGLLVFLNHDLSTNHDLMGILGKLENIDSMDKKLIAKMYNMLGFDTENSLMNKFVSSNNVIQAKSIHVDIRYPFPKKDTTPINFEMFKYNQDDLIPEIEEIILSIDDFYDEYLNYIRTEKK